MKPNLLIAYVSDVTRAKTFYMSLIDVEPELDVPAWVSFRLNEQTWFALSESGPEGLSALPRTSEVCLMVDPATTSIDETYRTWLELGATTVTASMDDSFGRTFVVADPDGILLRVTPFD